MGFWVWLREGATNRLLWAWIKVGVLMVTSMTLISVGAILLKRDWFGLFWPAVACFAVAVLVFLYGLYSSDKLE